MIVEHTFVTTLDAAGALGAATDTLCALGFADDPASSDSMATYRRGKKKAGRARRLRDLPQQVIVEYDRGRVTLAALIEEASLFRKSVPLMRRYLILLAHVLDGVLTRRETLEELQPAWNHLAGEIDRHDRSRRRGRAAVLFLIVLAVVLVIFLPLLCLP